MENLDNLTEVDKDDGTNVHKLTLSLTTLQRLLAKQTESGTVTQSQAALLHMAIAAGRAEARLIKLEIEKNGGTQSSSTARISEILLEYTTEIEEFMDILYNCINKLQAKNL